MIAHGITPPPQRFRPHLLIRLRDVLESGAKLTRLFRWELGYYFGSVDKAKLELRTDKRILNGWDPKRILLAIQRRHRLKLSLVSLVLRVEFGALVSAAERYFGSWRQALHAAEINPNLHFVHGAWHEVNKSSANCDTPKPGLARVKVSQPCDWSIGAILAEETNGELMVSTLAMTDALAKLLIARGITIGEEFKIQLS